MAGEQEKTQSAGEKAIADGRLEVGTGAGETASLEQGGKPVVKSADGIMLDVSDEGVEQQGINAGTQLETEDLTEAGEEGTDKEGDDKPEDKADETATDAEPLPDYDSANEEVTAKYDARFLKDDGEGAQSLNTEAIADEIRANMAKEGEARTERPNEGTYKWLKDKLGITKDVVDNYIDGEKAKYLANKAAMDEVTGGEEAWAAKLAWASSKDGKPGGYTKEQVDRFNAAMKKGGPEAAEQIELLNERYAKANGGNAKPTPKPGIGVRRPASPAKSATTGANTQSGGAPSAKPITKADYDTELAALRKMKPGAEQDAKHRELRARASVSQWFKAQR